MQFSLDSRGQTLANAVDAPSPSLRKRRRGATSMEYCVMASFILLVVIAAVQAFGFKVGSLFTSSAAATSQFSSGSKSNP